MLGLLKADAERRSRKVVCGSNSWIMSPSVSGKPFFEVFGAYERAPWPALVFWAYPLLG